MEHDIKHETQFRFALLRRSLAISLAMAATATALCISALAGWQRGGSLAERIVWVGISLVLVLSAHLLPALVRGASAAVRSISWLLWVTCMATACYGHATFFVLAERHAGEVRASIVPVVPVAPSARNLTVVMAERAAAVGQLATARARYCAGNCVTLDARRVTLAARLEALNAEADEIRQRHAVDDRVTAQREALLADPVTSRLAALLGTSVSQIDLLSGLAFAVVLECVACLLWSVALQPRPGLAVTPAVTPTVVSGHEPVARTHAPVSAPESVTETAVKKLANDVAAGRVRATVSDIRRHLGCSQAKAASLRRQLAEQATTS